jgi:2-(1,2-epoxy-1,2-dihydrophenyl)acetyl-CoA isomerase
MEFETIEERVEQGVALVLLNRPERRNALNNRMLEEMASLLDRLGGDSEVRAVVLAGKGKSFCAGQDLEAFETEVESVYEHITTRYKPVLQRLYQLNRPVIAAVQGAAAGAGMSLALACDFRILAPDAVFVQAFSKIGLVPDSGASWFLVRKLGYSRAFEIAVEGASLSADRCLELGLANRIVPTEQLLPEALSWGARLAGGAPMAIGLTKKSLQFAEEQSLEQVMEMEAQLQHQAVAGPEFKEGLRAFKEKRQPSFSAVKG